VILIVQARSIVAGSAAIKAVIVKYGFVLSPSTAVALFPDTVSKYAA